MAVLFAGGILVSASTGISHFVCKVEGLSPQSIMKSDLESEFLHLITLST